MPGSGLLEFELWNRGGWPRVDVVGEKFHTDEIKRLFPARRTSGSDEFTGPAHLVPEPHNPHDQNAVAVRVQGHLIGYLAKEQAARYAKVLSDLLSNGYVPTTSCVIWAHEYDEWQGTDRRGRDVYRSVVDARATVVLDEPHLCVPANLPPATGHRVLPHGGALQVKGEEEHLDVLAPLVRDHGESWVYATLHLVTLTAGRSSKQVVEIRIDGEPIGHLTPAMSAHFIPTIQHLADASQLVAAKTLLKGNPIQVEAILHAARGHELDAAWLAPSDGSSRSAAAAPLQPDAPPRSTTDGPNGAAALPPVVVPPKPTSIRFRVPPGWPPPPDGWEPPAGWAPKPEWPRPPEGWSFWTLA